MRVTRSVLLSAQGLRIVGFQSGALDVDERRINLIATSEIICFVFCGESQSVFPHSMITYHVICCAIFKQTASFIYENWLRVTCHTISFYFKLKLVDSFEFSTHL